MMLTWKKIRHATLGTIHLAAASGMRYEIVGRSQTFTARVYRVGAADLGREVASYPAEGVTQCKAWCQKYENDRLSHQAKADQVRRRTPRLKPRVPARSANIG